jgi:hypothetical protein
MTRNNIYELPPYPQEPPPAYTSLQPNRDVAQRNIQIPTTTPVLARTPANTVAATASVNTKRPVPSPIASPRPQERTRNNDAFIDIPLSDAVAQHWQANSSTSTPTRRRLCCSEKIITRIYAFFIISVVVLSIVGLMITALGAHEMSDEEKCNLEKVLDMVPPDCHLERRHTV